MPADAAHPAAPPRIATWLAVAAVAVAATYLAYVLGARSDFMDLAVYAWGGRAALDPTQLYDLAHPTLGLRFTYTPFAAIAFAALEAVGLLHAAPWTLLGLAALARACVLLARHRGAWLPAWRTWQVAALLAACTVLTEPATETLRLGQVNFLLLWLVVEGLLGPSTRLRGVLVGLAAAIKLTPGVFVVLLVFVGRVRDALVATGVVLATTAGAWLALPAESRAFWTGAGTDTSRIGRPEFVANQSINGLWWRLAGHEPNRAAWFCVALVAAALVLWLARDAWLRGEPVLATGLAGLAGLLASPMSWSHHWVLALPLVVGLLGAPTRRTSVRVLALTATAVLASRVIFRVPHDHGLEFGHTVLQLPLANAYLLCAAAFVAAAVLARPRDRRTPVTPP